MHFPLLLLNVLYKLKYIYNVHAILQMKCLKKERTLGYYPFSKFGIIDFHLHDVRKSFEVDS